MACVWGGLAYIVGQVLGAILPTRLGFSVYAEGTARGMAALAGVAGFAVFRSPSAKLGLAAATGLGLVILWVAGWSLGLRMPPNHRGPDSPDGHTVRLTARDYSGLICDWYPTVEIRDRCGATVVQWHGSDGWGEEGLERTLDSMKWTSPHQLEFITATGPQTLLVK